MRSAGPFRPGLTIALGMLVCQLSKSFKVRAPTGPSCFSTKANRSTCPLKWRCFANSSLNQWAVKPTFLGSPKKRSASK